AQLLLELRPLASVETGRRPPRGWDRALGIVAGEQLEPTPTRAHLAPPNTCFALAPCRIVHCGPSRSSSIQAFFCRCSSSFSRLWTLSPDALPNRPSRLLKLSVCSPCPSVPTRPSAASVSPTAKQARM